MRQQKLVNLCLPFTQESPPIMTFRLASLFLFAITISFISCKCNTLGDCETLSASFKIQPMRGDTILLKGPNAPVNRSQVNWETLESNGRIEVPFVDTINGIIHLFSFHQDTHLLEIEGYLSDTISAEVFTEREFFSCCPSVETDFIRLGTEKICEGSCDEVIVVDL